MGSVRPRLRLFAVSTVVAAAATAAALTLVTTNSASAAPARSHAPVASAAHEALAASTTPVQMNYACTSIINGFMRYVSSPTQCSFTEKAVRIVPGPVYVCVYLAENGAVRQVRRRATVRHPRS
jgi:hypothetical protein